MFLQLEINVLEEEIWLGARGRITAKQQKRNLFYAPEKSLSCDNPKLLFLLSFVGLNLSNSRIILVDWGELETLNKLFFQVVLLLILFTVEDQCFTISNHLINNAGEEKPFFVYCCRRIEIEYYFFSKRNLWVSDVVLCCISWLAYLAD